MTGKEGGARWAGSPSLAPWSPGGPGPQLLRGKTERKDRRFVGPAVTEEDTAEARSSEVNGEEARPRPQHPGIMQSQAEAACCTAHQPGAPGAPPQVLLSHTAWLVSEVAAVCQGVPRQSWMAVVTVACGRHPGVQMSRSSGGSLRLGGGGARAPTCSSLLGR